MNAEQRVIARVAYRSYVKQAGGVSLAPGDQLPDWDDLEPGIQEAWGASATAVATFMKARAADAFYGYAETF